MMENKEWYQEYLRSFRMEIKPFLYSKYLQRFQSKLLKIWTSFSEDMDSEPDKLEVIVETCSFRWKSKSEIFLALKWKPVWESPGLSNSTILRNLSFFCCLKVFGLRVCCRFHLQFNNSYPHLSFVLYRIS